MRWFTATACLSVVSGLLCGCPRGADTPPAATDSAPQEPEQIEAKGLHNVYRLSATLYSGSSPDGDEGFASLQQLGVKTVISVDGARPDVEQAHKYGLRYVHLPIGYDGVPEEQGLRIARAVRDLPGPVYVHCHHGKHRGPAAAAVARLCVDESCSIEAALEGMRRAGTDRHYTGLYAAPKELRRPTKEELNRIPADFPEVAKVEGLAQVMVGIDERWERLKEVRLAGWQSPLSHPDVDPAHEALQLVEHYREAGRLPEVKERVEEFQRWLSDAEASAAALERALRQAPVDGPAADKAFGAAGAACSRCHAQYRDVPRGRH
jgi:protein tyrosine phosphatase (PTP) superfamily phosphohydrolase (DUF442 family)